jgi:hypothetical protein
MANERNRTDEEFAVPRDEGASDSSGEQVRDRGIGEDVRSIADEEDDEIEDMDDLEDEEENESSF